MERLLNMILRRLMNKGINSGIRAVSNRGKRDEAEGQGARPRNQPVQKNARGLREATRMLRRLNKF